MRLLLGSLLLRLHLFYFIFCISIYNCGVLSLCWPLDYHFGAGRVFVNCRFGIITCYRGLFRHLPSRIIHPLIKKQKS